jgi:hypothetical protein
MNIISIKNISFSQHIYIFKSKLVNKFVKDENVNS